MKVLDELRSLAQGASKRVLERAPAGVQDAVARIQARYENGRVDARRALEELLALEEQALKAAAAVLVFPIATIGAIRELYERVAALERTLAQREETIRALEGRIRDLERKT